MRLPGLGTEVWVGGAESAVGELLTPNDMRGTWLVDCAGEIAREFTAAASESFMSVFADIDSVPSSFDRIAGLARELAVRLADGNGDEAPGPPSRLYVMCSQGFNRSALVAGLILRELGAAPDEVLREIRRSRPGSLTNETFVRLLLEGSRG
ncbi:MAG: hypothetical protein Q8Q29_01905 [Actinomycetota bacterium]|nr:hypothetical protein [Actinomycetota bacterium]